jgi:hypothetical protein
MAPSSLLTGVALSADDLVVWAAGLKAAAETARMQAIRTRIVVVVEVVVERKEMVLLTEEDEETEEGGCLLEDGEQDGGVHARPPS